ncbi:hypothetical protein RAS1_20560 [Phycisphaerae bacterium RAS1]|nr:hypothetical protein RAS1_20560 [Phycisphaerae bacterium RAS1]
MRKALAAWAAMIVLCTRAAAGSNPPVLPPPGLGGSPPPSLGGGGRDDFPIGGAPPPLLGFVDTIPGQFIDLAMSAGATDLLLGDNDSAVINTAIGNEVFPAGRLAVANNGGVAFGTPPSDLLPAENEEIPSMNAFGGGQGLFPYWDDIGDTVRGRVLYEEFEDRIVIQWEDRPLDGARDGPPVWDGITFQIQIFDARAATDLLIQFLYDDIDSPGNGGESATLAYQDGGRGFNDTQWAFNTPMAVGGMRTTLSLVPEPTALWPLAMMGLALLRRRA